MRACFLLLVFSLAASPAPRSAQQAQSHSLNEVHFPPSNTIDWPAGVGGSGPFARAVVGRMTGEDELSAVVLKGGIATLVYRPTHFVALSDVSSTQLRDVTVLPSPDATGIDALVGSSASGLVRYLYDPTNQTFASEAIGGAAWANASRVLAAQLDDTPALELVGLGESRHEALVLAWEPGVGTVAEFSLPIGMPCHHLDVLDWDEDGDQDLVVYHDDAVEVWDLELRQEIDSVRTLAPGGMLAALRNPSGTDHLALVARNAPSTQNWLFTFASGGYVGPTSLAFPPPGGGPAVQIELVDAASADHDGDGDLDLLLTQRSWHQAFLLDNVGSASQPVFDLAGGSYERIDLSSTPSTPASANKGIAAFADLDRDPLRTADMVFPLDTTGGLVIQLSAPELQYSSDGDPPVWEFFDAISTYDQGPTEGALELRLRDIPTWFTTTYQYLQVTIWNQDDPVTPSTAPPTDSVALANTLHQIPAGGPSDLLLPVTVPHGGDLTSTGGYVWSDRAHLYLLVRFVRAVPNGQGAYQVTDSSHPLALGMTLPGTEAELSHLDPTTNPAYQYLIQNGIEDVLVQLLESQTSGPGFLNASIGAVVPQPGIAPFGVPTIPYAAAPGLGQPTAVWFP